MKEQLISFQLAKLAKEKGFDLDEYLSIDDENPKNLNSNFNPREYQPWYLNVSQSLLQRWLREIHKIHINVWFKGDMIYDYNSLDWCYEIKSLKENFSIIENRTNFKSFEQALEESLYQALLLI